MAAGQPVCAVQAAEGEAVAAYVFLPESAAAFTNEGFLSVSLLLQGIQGHMRSTAGFMKRTGLPSPSTERFRRVNPFAE